MAHDFKKFPELTNNQMNLYYFDSPHEQITSDFDAKVVGVHDGDTVRLKAGFRDFTFPLRFSNILAAEINEEGGIKSRDRLRTLIDGASVEIIVDKTNRVGKYGRLLGEVRHKGMDIGEQMISEGFAIGLDEERPGVTELIIKGII